MMFLSLYVHILICYLFFGSSTMIWYIVSFANDCIFLFICNHCKLQMVGGVEHEGDSDSHFSCDLILSFLPCSSIRARHPAKLPSPSSTCVYIFIHTHVYLICMHVHTCADIMQRYVYTCIFMHKCVFVYICIREYTFTFVCVCMRMQT